MAIINNEAMIGGIGLPAGHHSREFGIWVEAVAEGVKKEMSETPQAIVGVPGQTDKLVEVLARNMLGSPFAVPVVGEATTPDTVGIRPSGITEIADRLHTPVLLITPDHDGAPEATQAMVQGILDAWREGIGLKESWRKVSRQHTVPTLFLGQVATWLGQKGASFNVVQPFEKVIF